MARGSMGRSTELRVSATRRQFLSRAALAGIAVAATPAFATEPGAEEDSGTTPGLNIDPGFIYGRIVDIGNSGTLAILDGSDCSTLRMASLTTGSRVWKNGLLNEAALARGDVVYARGEQEEAGVLLINRLWANIDNFWAQVLAARPKSLSLRTTKTGQDVDVNVSDVTRTVLPGGVEVPGVPGVVPGDVIQIVTFGDLTRNERTATLVYPPASFASVEDTDPIDYLPKAPIGGDGGQYKWSGIATWFCCGGVCNACGSEYGCSGCATCCCDCSGSACPDRCHRFKSSYHGIAWPEITKCNGASCGPYGGASLLPTGFPRVKCGKCVNVFNPCSNQSQTVRVRDCGPTVRSATPRGCRSYGVVRFDLTPCSFSAIADLSEGRINLRSTDPLPCWAYLDDA